MSNSVTVQSRSNVPANLETEAANLLATTKSHEKLLKFKKSKFYVMDDEVAIGREFIAHANQLTTGWIKFVGNQVVEYAAIVNESRTRIVGAYLSTFPYDFGSFQITNP